MDYLRNKSLSRITVAIAGSVLGGAALGSGIVLILSPITPSPLYWLAVFAGLLLITLGVTNIFGHSKPELRSDSGQDLWMRSAYESAVDASVVIDETGKIEHFNLAAQRIFGYSTEEVIGQDVSILMPQSEREEHKKYINDWNSVAPRVIGKLRELNAVKKDGSQFPVEIVITPIETEDGNKVVGLIRDISERKEAENKLREREDRLSDIIESTSDWVWETDADLRYTYISDRVLKVFNLEPSEFLGRTRQELAAQLNWIVDEEKWENHLKDLENHRPFQNFEFSTQFADGKLIHIQFDGKPIFDENGKFAGYRGASRDITAHKNAELELQERANLDQLMRISVIASNEAVSVEEAVQNCLRDVCSYTGWKVGHAYFPTDDDPPVLITSKIWHMDDPERYQKLKEITESTPIKFGQGQPGMVMEQKAARWRPIGVDKGNFPRQKAIIEAGLRSCILTPVMVGSEVVAVLDFFNDVVSDRDEKLVEAFHQIGTQLGRVIEREKARESLLEAKEQADIANRAKSEFLSSMSHELRTPMNAILGFSQFLEKDPRNPLNETQQDKVKQILTAGDHLLTLINEVLDLAKIESSDIEVSIEPVQLGSVISESVSIVGQLADKFGVTIIETPVEDELPFVHADFVRLKQIIINLLSNAIKYNQTDGEVGIRCDLTDDNTCRVSIWDTGYGIAKNRQADVFKPFNRLGREASNIQGTGLGLSVTQHLIDMMGGKIGFESVENEGSTFWFELPLAVGAEIPVLENRVKDPHRTDLSDLAIMENSGTAIYVEDNIANFQLMRDIFEFLPNMNLLHARTGEEAIDMVNLHEPDIVLMDIDLPGMDGMEALREIRSMEKNQILPVIGISANAMPNQIKEAKAAGFDQTDIG